MINCEFFFFQLLSEVKDSYSEFLDSKYGSNINDNSIFTALPRHWENEFHEDMHSLNVSFHNYFSWQTL